MVYKLDDFRQAVTGAGTGIFGLLLFFVFGQEKSGVVIKPVVGFAITIIFLVLSYHSIKKFLDKNATTHLAIDYSICIALAISVTFMFEMIDWPTILSFDFFGTIPIIVSWIIFIPAIIFDIKDTNTFLEKWSYYGGNGNGKFNVETKCRMKHKSEKDVRRCISRS